MNKNVELEHIFYFIDVSNIDLQTYSDLGVVSFTIQRRLFLVVEIVVEGNHGAIHFIKVFDAIRNSIAALAHGNAFPIRASKFPLIALECRKWNGKRIALLKTTY